MLSIAIKFCYIYFPATLWLSRLIDFDFPRIAFDIFMITLLVFSSLGMLITGRQKNKYIIAPILIIGILILFFLAAAKIIPYGFETNSNWLNYFMEMKPIFYLTCVLILFSHRSERDCIEESILYGSVFLSILIIIDFFIRSLAW